MTQPRGIRNCNPGNIRNSDATDWKGEIPSSAKKDNAFEEFEDMAHGYRALIRQLQNYHRLHGCRTIADYIRRRAPRHENNTSAYTTAVSQKMQVPSTYEPDVNDRDTMTAFAASISEVENGVPAQMADIRAGWDIL